MKSETKKALFFLTLIGVYLLQGISEGHKFSYVYCFGFIFSVVLLYIINNKFIAVLTGVCLLLTTLLYDKQYAPLTVIAFFLISAHKALMQDVNVDKKSKKEFNGFSFCCVQISVLSTVALFIYDFMFLSKVNMIFSLAVISRAILIFILIIGLFVYSCFKSKTKQNKTSLKISKGFSDSLRFIYLVSIISFFSTVWFSYVRISYMNMSYDIVFFPWFVYICTMAYNGDVYLEALAKDAEGLLEKISYRDMVK